MKFNAVLLIALVGLIHGTQGQVENLPDLPPPSTLGRFIVAIAEIQREALTTTVRCVGTAFTQRHVLTTAHCATAPEITVQINFVNASNAPASMNCESRLK